MEEGREEGRVRNGSVLNRVEEKKRQRVLAKCLRVVVDQLLFPPSRVMFFVNFNASSGTTKGHGQSVTRTHETPTTRAGAMLMSAVV